MRAETASEKDLNHNPTAERSWWRSEWPDFSCGLPGTEWAGGEDYDALTTFQQNEQMTGNSSASGNAGAKEAGYTAWPRALLRVVMRLE